MCTINSPCIHCEKKGCGSFHSQCKKYNDFLEEFHAQKELEKKMRNKEHFLNHDRAYRMSCYRRG